MFYSWVRAKQIEILERQWKLPAPVLGEQENAGEMSPRSNTAAQHPVTPPDRGPEHPKG
jgi:hypothetical protein